MRDTNYSTTTCPIQNNERVHILLLNIPRKNFSFPSEHIWMPSAPLDVFEEYERRCWFIHIAFKQCLNYPAHQPPSSTGFSAPLNLDYTSLSGETDSSVIKVCVQRMTLKASVFPEPWYALFALTTMLLYLIVALIISDSNANLPSVRVVWSTLLICCADPLETEGRGL